uniref:Uncharacterized protein n=1 Tax=Anguilla anguilla TaxID=7936 RepID=A0A0E9VJU6_ANGAN
MNAQINSSQSKAHRILLCFTWAFVSDAARKKMMRRTISHLFSILQ